MDTSRKTESSANDAPLVSVIIPALNEERHITLVLEALELQTLPSQSFEVILVDNGSTDSTLQRAEVFRSRIPLTILSLRNCTISAVRNIGAASARGQVLAFLDADCIPAPNWLERSLSLASDQHLWGAHYATPTNATWVGTVWATHQAREHAGDVTFLPGGSVFATRSAFDLIGGFPEHLQTAEDVEFSARARRHGLRVVASPDLAVVHLGTPRALGHFYRQNRWHGTHVFRMFLANLPSTRNLPIVGLSVFTLLMVWATLICLPLGIWLHRPLLFLLPFAALLLPPLLLSTLKCLRARKLADLPALAVLYLTYFLGRAASVLQLSARNHR